jgi:membrane-associated phospholipid phosphatase
MVETASQTEAVASASDRPVERSHWWREVLISAAFYFLYSLVRDARGSKPVSELQARTNAKRIISLERHVGIFHEANVQHWFLGSRWLIRFLDDFYDTAHFVAVIVVLVVLFFVFPARYRLWRNTLAFTTGLALLGFYFFPLMPPRLLPAHYDFVDTLRVYGGLWNFSSGAINKISDQYAAMPSLHTSWSLWCALALMSVVRPWWGKILLALYPVLTIFSITVTANHYFADAIAGIALVAVSYVLAKFATARADRLHARLRARWSRARAA